MEKGEYLKGLKLIADVVFVSFSLVLSYLLFFKSLPSAAGFSVYLCASLIALYFFGLYGVKELSLSDALKHILKAITLVFIFALGFLIYAKNFYEIPLVILVWIFNLIFLTGWRLLFRRITYFEPFKTRVLIIGIGHDEKFILKNLYKHHKFRIIGFVADATKKEIEGIVILGQLKKIRRIIKTHFVDEIIFANPKLTHEELVKIVELCKGTNVKFRAIPSVYERLMKDFVEEKVDYLPLVDLVVNPVPAFDRFLKRVMDIIASAILLIILSPIFFIIALLIKLDSPGPVFYNQERVGKAGKPFMIHKFRSMIPNAEKGIGPMWAKKQDPRETRIGGFLRSKSLDELPNLFNVLKGEMSLVGPRAERSYFVKKFDKYIRHWNERLEVMPGLTGLAEVHGDYDLSPRKKLRYDIQYIENYSLWLDVKLLFQTLWMEIAKKRNY